MKPIARCIALFLFSFPLFASIEFSVWNGSTVRAEPGSPADVIVAIANTGPDTALNAKVTIALPAGTTVVSMRDVDSRWTCTAEAPGIVCTTPAFVVDTTSFIILGKFGVVVPEQHAGNYFELPITFTSSNVAQSHPYFLTMLVPRVAHVTTTADSGAGSLRSAIETLDAGDCMHLCVVRFDVAQGSTFAPLTPLPPFTACGSFEVRGGLETRAGTRPYELSGANVASGNGLEVQHGRCGDSPQRTSLWVTGLAINGFPEDGLRANGGYATCFGCFIGTDVTGTVAKPNGLRGVGVERFGGVNVSQSIVSGNLRSGIFGWFASNVYVYDTWVGLDANGGPLPNGASGIFVNSGDLELNVSRVAYNHHFGVGFGADGYGVLRGVSVHSNGLGAIDYGLDGPTQSGPRMPDRPELIDATYDAARNVTTIRGRVTITKLLGVSYAVAAYASSRDGDAETPLAESYIPAAVGTHEFTITVNGDQRGKIITANLNCGPWLDGGYTLSGELSNGIAVTASSAARTPW